MIDKLNHSDDSFRGYVSFLKEIPLYISSCTIKNGAFLEEIGMSNLTYSNRKKKLNYTFEEVELIIKTLRQYGFK